MPSSCFAQRSLAFIFVPLLMPRSLQYTAMSVGVVISLLKTNTTRSPPASGPAKTSVFPADMSGVRARQLLVPEGSATEETNTPKGAPFAAR